MIVYKHSRLLLLIPCVLFVLNGCMFMRLSEDLKAVETKVALIRGQVSYPTEDGAPLLLLLFTNTAGEKAIADFAVMERPGLYAFLVPRGAYYVAAFSDLNRNMRPDDGELYGVYGASEPTPVVIDQKGTVNRIDLVVDRVIREEKIDAAFWTGIVLERAYASAYITAAGVVADLDDSRFSPAYAQKGLWQPYAALKEVGIGLYFLGAYDPAKIPVLFVYGASGHAQNWRVLFDKMDREHFQPWFFNYPSGLDLEFVGDALNGAIQWLHSQYRFDCLFVAAHSMGGLVARYAILQNAYEDDQDYIRLLVTISTPWGGHQAAAKGVKYAPAVVPSWRNMAPDSEFLADLYPRPLPPAVPHYLLFSYSGRSGIMEENNDGAVTLESQLDYRAQWQTEELHGFAEDHVAVLFSEDLAKRFNTILDARAAALPNRTWRTLRDMGFQPTVSPGLSEKKPPSIERH
jgi:pimeloyl-ACP methyl ester carboxylesterase